MNGAQLEPLVRDLRKLVEAQATRDLSDAQLLERFARGRDEAAFAALMCRHGGLVWHVCRQVLHQEQDAEDAFQASFLVLALKAPSLRRGQGLGNWLYGVAYRVAMNARRKATRRQAHESRKAAATPRALPAADALHELQTLLHEEINHLPAQYRVTVVLCGLEGKSKSEAAKELGWKEGTVSGRLARARKMLEARLARRGVLLSAAWAATMLCAEAGAAVIPSTLVGATTDAALHLAAGKALTAGVVSSQVAALMKGALKAMSLTERKLALTCVLALVLLGAGAGVAAYAAFANKPTQFSRQLPARESDDKPAPPGKKAPVDLYGDPLPAGAVTRLGTVRFRHGRLSGMALSPDGKVAVTVGKGLNFWEVPSGKMIHHVERDGPWYVAGRSVAFSPDGKMVATMVGGVLRIWDRATAERIAWASGQKGGACLFDTYCLSFSPDSKMIAAAGLGGPDPVPGKPGPADCSDLRLWKIGGEELEQLWEAMPDVADPAKPGPSAPKISSLAFSPDGKQMASAGVAQQNNFIRIWDVATGKELRQLSAAGREVGTVAYSPDGTTLASGSDDGTVTLWDPATGQKQRQMKAPGGARSLAFSPDGARLAGGGGPQDWWSKQPNNEPFLIVWDARTGKESYRLPTDRDSVVSLAYTADGKTLAAGLGGAIRLWDAANGKEIAHPLAGHQNSMLAVDVSPDGTTVATAGQDGVIILWDLATGQENQRLRGHRGEVRSIKYAPGGKALVSAGTDQTFRVWDVASGRETRRLDGNLKGRISATATSADGRLVAAGDRDSGDVLVWDLRSGGQKFVFTLDIEETTLKCLAFSPDGKSLAAGTTDGPIYVWDMTTGKELHKLKHSTVTSLAFAPDGRMFVSAGDGPVTLWDALTGERVDRLGDGKVESKSKVVAFSPDGRTIAVEHGTNWDGKGRIRLFEMLTNKVRQEFIGHPAGIHSLVFSPDGKSLISASLDSTALVWDLTGQPNRGAATAPLTDDQLHSLWQTLASDDAAEAARAIWSFALDPKRAVPFIEKALSELPKLRDAPALIADLDSDQFTVREKAQRELEILGKMAEPALRRALAGGASPEVRRRVERLLEKLQGPVRNGDILQRCRAIEILEQIGASTPGPDAPRLAALDLLKKLAAGAPEARLTQEAKAAVDRLGKRATANP